MIVGFYSNNSGHCIYTKEMPVVPREGDTIIVDDDIFSVMEVVWRIEKGVRVNYVEVWFN